MPLEIEMGTPNDLYESCESPRTSTRPDNASSSHSSTPEKVKLIEPALGLCPTTQSSSPSPPPSEHMMEIDIISEPDLQSPTTQLPDLQTPTIQLPDRQTTSNIKTYHCPMISCDTERKENEIETHLENDHPDLFVLYKRDLQAVYGLSTQRCFECEFHFATIDEFEQHKGDKCSTNATRTIADFMIAYLRNQCSDTLLEVTEGHSTEDQYNCPVIECSENWSSLGLLCWHMESTHIMASAYFRRTIDCPQLSGARCDTCGFSFPSTTMWPHPCSRLSEISMNTLEAEKLSEEVHGDPENPHSLVNGDVEVVDDYTCPDCGDKFDNDKSVYCHKWQDNCEPNPLYATARLAEATSTEAANEAAPDALNSSFTPATTDVLSRYSLSGVQEEWSRGPVQTTTGGRRGNDLSYKCPIRSCGKAFSKLGGIFKHLVPAHGYSGVLFRMNHNVPGLMMICETCKWNYADKNAIYKHRHLNTCVSNIRITKEQEETYESDPNRKPLEEVLEDIEFNVLADVSGDNYRHQPRAKSTPKVTTQSPTPPAAGAPVDLPVGCDMGLTALQQLGLDSLTAEDASTLLKLIQSNLKPDGTINIPSNVSPEKEHVTSETSEIPDDNVNICPSWGCKRRFTAFTHGGKSNISSLWIHMQNAHKNAFVVFRRMQRRGFDRYCEKCKFWLKGAEWYNHKNLRRYQTEGSRPEGTYCDVYQKLAHGLDRHENPLFLVDIKMCVEKYDCIVADALQLINEQSAQDDDSSILKLEEEELDIAHSPEASLDSPSMSGTDSPMPAGANPNTNMVCPIKTCKKQVVKPDTLSQACWKNLFTHIKANHKNAYVLFRRVERENTKKQCSDCLFWFVNYRDYGAHNQRTGTNRDGGPKISYCQQYQAMAQNDCKVKSIHELPPYEALDFRVLENVYRCKIPFDMEDGQSSPDAHALTITEIIDPIPDSVKIEPQSQPAPPSPFGHGSPGAVNPAHLPEEGQYLCPVMNCGQLIKTMKGVLGHMRIKHKREYVIFRRTKMALAHRKCEKCQFWFQSAKTYHQHKSQLPHQLPGENKGSECDAYIRIAGNFSPVQLADHANFVSSLFDHYVTSTYQDKPHSRRKTNDNYLNKLTLALTNRFQVNPPATSEPTPTSPPTSVEIKRPEGWVAVPTPENETIIECPIHDCPIQLKFSSLNIHFSRKHPASFFHFKRSDFDVFTVQCGTCSFGYYNQQHFQHSHRDCSLQTEERFREKVLDLDFEQGRNNFAKTLKIVDCPVNTRLNESASSSPVVANIRGKSQDIANLGLKQEDLDRYDSISDVKAHCPDKSCIYVAPLRTLTTHVSEKHPKLNVAFRTKPSDYFDQMCDSCGFYFYSRSAIYNHKSTKKCEYYATERAKYEKWAEDTGAEAKSMIVDQVRKSIKFTRYPSGSNKRKSVAPEFVGDSKRQRTSEDTELDSSELNSSTEEAFVSLPEPRDCPFCQSKCLAGTFTGLCAHIRGSHAERYIEFRTTRWPTTTFMCERCKFGTEMPEEVWKRQHSPKVCNDNIASFKKYDTSNLSFEEPTRGDERSCPVCNQTTLGVKGLVTHMRFAHPDSYLNWRTVPNEVMGFQCSICGFCYSTENELHNHTRKDGACKRNIDQLTNGLESTSSKNQPPQSSPGKSAEETTSDEMSHSSKGREDLPSEYNCTVCQNGVSFPTFGLLNVHMKSDHEKEYIHFRITKTDQISIRCSICQFCFPAKNHHDRHLTKKACAKNKRLYEDYVESLEDDGDDSDQ